MQSTTRHFLKALQALPQFMNICHILWLIALLSMLCVSSNDVYLEQEFTVNTTLQSSKTYHVINDVIIYENVYVNIAPNVTIIFQEDHTIIVRGAIHSGCPFMDTFSDDNIGILSQYESVTIYANNTLTRKGIISIESTLLSSFCNTLFSNLYIPIAVYNQANTYLLVDNCEFDNNFFSIHLSRTTSLYDRIITDSIFKNGAYGIYQIVDFIVDHNLFIDYTYTAVYVSHSNVIINNNTFINQGNSGAIAGYGSNITFNTIIGWSEGINIDYYLIFYIKFNTFINNTKAVRVGGTFIHYINHNNFIGNTFSIALSGVNFGDNQPHCNYNYFGTNSTDQSIVSQQILDICDGETGGLITWWPWYTELIDFASTINETESTLSELQCKGPNNLGVINGTKLDALYLENVTLTSSQSPYYVSHDVYISDGISLFVESSVEIVFIGDYYIQTRGPVFIGDCQSSLPDHNIGLHSQSTAIMIYNNDSSTQEGGVRIFLNASICNAKFKNLRAALDTYVDIGLLVDNCEFDHNYFDIYPNRAGSLYDRLITDSIFKNGVYGMHMIADFIVDHNLFIDYTSTAVLVYGTNVIVNNNTFNQAKISSGYDSNITFNTFIGWNGGIYGASTSYIKFNTFMDNYIAISITHVQPQYINYNNFFNNSVNIELKVNVNQEYCGYNWNGDVTNITDPSLIGNKMVDFCHSSGYLGIITFWPYFEEALYLHDMNNLPALYTFDFADCNSINGISGITSHLVPNQPTRSPTSRPTEPTSTPTRNPTYFPTMEPTVNPTADPTIVPTIDPTADPTILPTNIPTVVPTSDPTVDPTTDPSMYPTFDPTTDPTNNPTGVPTNDPTIQPTNDPTIDPTKKPTSDPTHDPTINPTTNPTIDPSSYPTIDPTIDPSSYPTTDPTVDPTVNPTSDPSTSPTISPTLAPLSVGELIGVNVTDESKTLEFNLLVLSMIVGILILLVLYALYKKYNKKDQIRVDKIYYWRFLSFCVQVFDVYSDILFTAQLYSYYHFSTITQYQNVNDESDKFFLLFIFSLLFTLIPYVVNMVSSFMIISQIGSNREGVYSDHTKTFMEKNVSLYSLGVLLSGGSFYTLNLLNSNFLSLKYFQCGLSSKQLLEFRTHKIFSTTILENIPQCIIQIYTMTRLGLINHIVILSFASSLFNILLTVLHTFNSMKLYQNKKEYAFSIDLQLDKTAPERTLSKKLLEQKLSKKSEKGNYQCEILSVGGFDVNNKTFSIYGVAVYSISDDDSIMKLLKERFDEKDYIKDLFEEAIKTDDIFKTTIGDVSYMIQEKRDEHTTDTMQTTDKKQKKESEMTTVQSDSERSDDVQYNMS